MSSLADPYLKTVRAKEHLDDLRERLRAFRESGDALRVTREDDLEKQLHHVRFTIKDIPERVPLVVGDFLYCLRSSLDQLVWALAWKPGTYPAKTQFPILKEPNPDLFARWTDGVPADAAMIIDELQPYHGQNLEAVESHLLWRLHLLCNIDKHRRIPTNSTIGIYNFPDFPRGQLHLAHFDHDAGVATVPLQLKSKMRLDPVASLDVTFGDSHEGISCNFSDLETMHEFVAKSVLPRFTRFF